MKTGSTVGKLQKVAEVAKVIESPKVAKPLRYNKKNFRENLKRTTGQSPPKTTHAHHVFPQELEKDFIKAGINVHDPKFGVWWESASHLDAHGKSKYNDYWDRYLKQNPDVSADITNWEEA